MDLDPLRTAAHPIAAHALVGLAALALGLAILLRRKGDTAHVAMGRLWVALTGFVALSGLFIHEGRTIGPFSAIHLLSVVTLTGLFNGVRAARRGNLARHRFNMVTLVVFGLGLAGALALLPDRTLHRMVFG